MLLGINPDYAAAHLLKLWCWALDNAPDGSLRNMEDAVIEHAAGWTGEAGAFVRAATEAGWIDAKRAFRNWRDYAGRLIKMRDDNLARLRQRVAKHRKLKKNGNASVTVTSLHVTGLQNLTEPDPTEPNRTVPESKAKPLSPRGSRLPADWTPDPDATAYAAGLGLDPSRVAADFGDYWRAVPGAKGVKLDWQATWRTWCRREADRSKPATTRPNVRPFADRNAPPAIAEPTEADASAAIARIRAEWKGAKS